MLKILTVFTVLTLLSVASSVQAHLMVEQHGSLNVIDNGAYLVLSLPISAFEEIDDDKDGALSNVEFTQHKKAIEQTVIEHVHLSDKTGQRPLEGIMFSLNDDSHQDDAHHKHHEPKKQLIVMGRFALADAQHIEDLSFSFDLFGKAANEKTMAFTAKWKANQQKQQHELTPTKQSVKLFN